MVVPVGIDWSGQEPLTEAELDRALAEIPAESRTWHALMQLFGVAFAAAVADSTDPRHTERTAGMAAGRLEAVLQLRQDLITRRARAAAAR